MASSTLKLVIQKGPREGETLEFNPRSTIRIGRVARGNNVTIKDSGISSKHLHIEFNSPSGKWIITDLDSSNGTFLNSSEIKPLSPFEISHGDKIIIGEITAIRVEIVEIKDEISVRRNTRRQGVVKSRVDLSENAEIMDGIERFRNPRKRDVSKNGAEFGGEDDEGLKLGENVEIKEVIEKCKNTRRRGVCKIGSDKSEEGSKIGENFEIKEAIEKCKNPRKRGVCKDGSDNIEEGSKLGENVEIKGDMNVVRSVEEVGNTVEERGEDCLDLEEGVEGRPRGLGRGRPEKANNLRNDGEDVENVIFKPDCGVSTRRTRSSKRRDDGLVNVVEAVPARRTRSAKNVEVAMEKIEEGKGLDADECKEVESVKAIENKNPRGGRGRKKKVEAEQLEKIQDVILEEKMNLEVSEKEVLDKGLELSGVESEAVFDDRRTENLGGIEDLDKESEADCCHISIDSETSTMPDLEKMTLGEWFDFLEVYLPKQIYTAGDSIIEDMRKQANLFDDFVLQHQRDKCRLPLGKGQATS